MDFGLILPFGFLAFSAHPRREADYAHLASLPLKADPPTLYVSLPRKTGIFRSDGPAHAPREFRRELIGPALKDIRNNFAQQRCELKGMAAIPCGDQQAGSVWVVVDPKISIP